jgi:hypothetical protein
MSCPYSCMRPPGLYPGGCSGCNPQHLCVAVGGVCGSLSLLWERVRERVKIKTLLQQVCCQNQLNPFHQL